MVKAKYSWLRGPGFKPPHYGDHFSGTIHLDQSMEQKICGKTLTWQCCICCKPANGWTLRHGWLIKSSTEWTVSLSANWDRSPKKVSREKELVKVDSFLSYILCSLCFHWYKTLCFTVANFVLSLLLILQVHEFPNFQVTNGQHLSLPTKSIY